MFVGKPVGALFIPQGGACKAAEAGVRILAEELIGFWKEQVPASNVGRRRLAVALPSGTGTTALFLARHLAHLDDITVFAIPCCGSVEYLKRQLDTVDAQSGDYHHYPHILSPLATEEPSPSYQFGQPSSSLWNIYQELAVAGLPLDLLYGPRAWQVMFQQYWEKREEGGVVGGCSGRLEGYSDVLYIHTGGMEGVASQLARYRRLGLTVGEVGVGNGSVQEKRM